MFSTARKTLKYTKTFILEHIDEYDIFRRYLGNVKLGVAYNSPLREDSNPSFSLFTTSNGNVLYKDHATGDSGDVFKLLSQMWGCTVKTVYKRVVDDIPGIESISLGRKKQIGTNRNLDIGIKRRYFNERDEEYWGRYLINKKTLYKYNVFAIDYYTISGIIRDHYKNDNPLYAYKVDDKFRLYKPLTPNKIDKWKGNLTRDNVFGYEQLPQKGDTLIITKSLKDVMVLDSLGYNAISPSSEATMIPNNSLTSLRTRFNRIVLFFDNDEPGIEFSKKNVEKYNLDEISIDPKYKVKDISDFIEKYGSEKTKEYVEEMLCQK